MTETEPRLASDIRHRGTGSCIPMGRRRGRGGLRKVLDCFLPSSSRFYIPQSYPVCHQGNRQCHRGRRILCRPESVMMTPWVLTLLIEVPGPSSSQENCGPHAEEKAKKRISGDFLPHPSAPPLVTVVTRQSSQAHSPEPSQSN